MDYTRFGKTGMKVSRICLGCMTYGSTKWRDWVLDEEASRPFIKQALERGINFFDTADIYSSAPAKRFWAGDQGFRQTRRSGDRHQAVQSDGSRRQSARPVAQAHHGGDRRLAAPPRDRLCRSLSDPSLRYDTPIEETVEALNEVVRAGKALYVGASSMWAWQFARMISAARERGLAEFVSMQNFYNLVYREEEREMMKLCADQNIAVIPWSPLARGFLAGSGVGAERGDGARAHRPVQRGARARLAAGRGDSPARRRRPPKSSASSRRWWRWRGCCRSRSSPRRSSAPRSRTISTTRSPRCR